MRSERILITGLTDDEQGTLDFLYAELVARSKRNLVRDEYYDGKRAIRAVGSIIPPQYFRLGIVLGWSARAVDLLARRCNLEQFVWPDGSLADIGGDVVWEDNWLDVESDSAVNSSLVHGVTFLITTRGDVSAGEPKALIHVKTALDATGVWNNRARRLDNLLSITGRDDKGKPTSLALYLPNLTITAEKVDGLWAVVDKQEHPWGVPAEPMVYKYRAGRPFGTSRISRPVMSIHDRAIRAVIRLEGHMDVYSFPELWLLGADESIFKNADGTQKAGWQVMLGRVKGIPDDDEAAQPRADVKKFEASSPEPHLAALNALAKEFARETSLPDASFALTDYANPTSADSYEQSRDDLIAEAEDATSGWRRAVARSYRTALAIANDLDEIPKEWRTINPKWRSPAFLSQASVADAGVKRLSSVPWLAETEVGLELLGLNEQQIKRALSERRKAEGRGVLQALRDAVPSADAV